MSDIQGGTTFETAHTLSGGNLTTWLSRHAYTVDINATVWDLMKQVQAENSNVVFSNPSGNYVDKITYNGEELGEFTNGALYGWMYTLNGKHPDLGVSEQFLENGDKIVFHYTDDYTKEQGSELWNDPVPDSGSADKSAAGKI